MENHFKSREAARIFTEEFFFFGQYTIQKQYKFFRKISFINVRKLSIRSVPDCGSESFPGAI